MVDSKFLASALGDQDPLFDDAARIVISGSNASASFIQRKLSIGYARAARLLDELQTAGVVGPADGAAPRAVLISSYEELKSAKNAGVDPEPDYSNYQVPNIDLTRPDNIPWGKHLSDVALDKFQIPLGYSESGALVNESLDKLDHLAVVGNPQSTKMAFIDMILASQLMQLSPKQLQLLLIDQSRYLNIYNGLPHLLSPVINEADKESSALMWTVAEIVRRQKIFSEAGARSMESYSKLSHKDDVSRILLVYRCLSIDPDQDYMLSRIASYGHLAGVHLIFVTDQFSGKNVSSQLKANLPTRMVFRVTSPADSSLAGVKSAELLSQGKAIYKGSTAGKDLPLDTVYTSEENVKEIVRVIIQN